MRGFCVGHGVYELGFNLLLSLVSHVYVCFDKIFKKIDSFCNTHLTVVSTLYVLNIL